MPPTRNHHIPLPGLGELERSGPWQVIRWGAFLGCSWTWVIGMFLPVMLLRDLGVWGWVIFAVPNVVGAAAMGTVLRSAAVSRFLTDRHATALYAFSAVTVGFQFYVVCWLAPGPWVALLLIPLVAMAIPDARRRVGPWLPVVGVAAAVLSWGAFSAAGRLDGAWLDVANNTLPERLPLTDLWFLAPGFLVGFALCPYLDPTFHRARQATAPRTGQLAFVFGFGVVFFSMIVFTLMYAGVLRPLVNGEGAESIAPPWRAILGIHIGLQVFFTVTVHLRELFRDAERRPVARAGQPVTTHAAGPRRHVLALLLILPVAFALLGQTDAATAAGLTAGEWGYRLFITVYGVFFPGYVLLCMLPTLRPRTDAFRLQVFWIATVLGAPLCVMGLATGPMAWLLGLYGVLAAARVVLDVGPAGPQSAK
mgnify:CR=1 FL=1